MRRIAAALCVVVLLAGCASSSAPVRVTHDTSTDQTKYATKLMRLRDLDLRTSRSSPPRVYVQVQGTCSGQECSPSQYTLRFMKEGQKAVAFASRDVEIEVGTKTMRWEDRQNNEQGRPVRIRSGEIVRVNVSGGQLATLGSVQTVEGSLGGARFVFPYDERAPIRQLLQKLEADESASS